MADGGGARGVPPRARRRRAPPRGARPRRARARSAPRRAVDGARRLPGAALLLAGLRAVRPAARACSSSGCPGARSAASSPRSLRVGDEVEVRGPMGRWFTWDGADPVLCVGGGTGVVPFVSMLRHARDVGALDRLQARRRGAGAAAAAVRRRAWSTPAPRSCCRARLGATVRRAGSPRPTWPRSSATAAGCWSAARPGSPSRPASLLVALGVPPDAVRVERFGATG
nr:hypothetical protein [Angustibacter aerolatus]